MKDCRSGVIEGLTAGIGARWTRRAPILARNGRGPSLARSRAKRVPRSRGIAAVLLCFVLTAGLAEGRGRSGGDLDGGGAAGERAGTGEELHLEGWVDPPASFLRGAAPGRATGFGAAVALLLVTTLWRRDDDGWRLLHHQQTLVP